MTPLCLQDLQEPKAEEGSALRYAHQATPVLSREQYVAVQHREMAKRRNDTGEKEASLPLWILLMGWVPTLSCYAQFTRPCHRKCIFWCTLTWSAIMVAGSTMIASCRGNFFPW